MCKLASVDHDALAAQVLRQLRGARSQEAFRRKLGYRSNVAHAWETGRSWPTAARFLWAAERLGYDVSDAVRTFYRRSPEWMATAPPATPAGVAALLADLRGQTPIVRLAESSGFSRYSIARWLSGEAEPRLPTFFALIEATSLRLLDYLATLFDPATLPAASEAWERLELARRTAYELPWSHAVLRALELDGYRSRRAHEPGWIAQRVGISREEEQRCLELLERAGQVELCDDRWQLVDTLSVDTRRDPERARELKVWWAQVGVEQLRTGKDGQFSYNLFAVSRADLEALRELSRAYYREVRTIVARSQPAETVALLNLQLFELGEEGEGEAP